MPARFAAAATASRPTASATRRGRSLSDVAMASSSARPGSTAPPSSPARNTNGLNVEAGWRRARTAMLNCERAWSWPPTITTTRPSTDMVTSP